MFLPPEQLHNSGGCLGVRTCELVLCFGAIVRVRAIMLTSLFSLFYVTGEFHRFLHRDRAQFSQSSYPLQARYEAGARYTKSLASLELHHKEHNNDPYSFLNNTIDFMRYETIVHILTWYIKHHPDMTYSLILGSLLQPLISKTPNSNAFQ